MTHPLASLLGNTPRAVVCGLTDLPDGEPAAAGAPNRGKSGIRFSLALTVSAEQIDTAVKLMGEAIAEVSA